MCIQADAEAEMVAPAAPQSVAQSANPAVRSAVEGQEGLSSAIAQVQAGNKILMTEVRPA